MKKIAFLTCILLCLAFSVKSQKLNVAGTDPVLIPQLSSNDYWNISYIVFQWNTTHTSIIGTWQGDALSPNEYQVSYPGSGNSFNSQCPFSISGNLPDISTPDFRVYVGVKRYSDSYGTFVCGYQALSVWMNTYNLLNTPFYVSGTLN
jgi:hypothetical protein